jgi:hypothetical protein
MNTSIKRKKEAYKLIGTVFAFACVLSMIHVIYVASTIPEAQAAVLPKHLGGSEYEFVGKKYISNSECGLMVAQYVLTEPYSLDKIAPYMKFSTDDCDPNNPPNWDECPRWVKTDLGFCDNLSS